MEEGFVLEGIVLYAAIVVPILAGMLVCYGRSMFARLLIVAAAIIIVSVGIGSVYAALNDRPWQYVSLPLGRYIDFFAGLFLLGTIVGTIWALPNAAEAKAAEDAHRAAEAKAAEEARRAAKAKAAEDARRAAEAKAAEDARRAAEAKAAEEARRAAEAKVAEEARRAAEANVARRESDEIAKDVRRVARAKAGEVGATVPKDARRVSTAKKTGSVVKIKPSEVARSGAKARGAE
jgi:Stage III sporulation protein AF (Spore_III_AF)